MKTKSATFITSATSPSGFPHPELPEIAFAGRSNVGKSSLINKLVGVPKLARTSRTPGRTRLINWFKIQPRAGRPLCFVDLPGYGYAKVPKAMRASWQPLIEAFLSDRASLRALVLLVDARRGAQDEEIELLSWLEHADLPVIVALTKIDKLAKNKRKPVGFAAQRALAPKRPPILVSAHTGEGLDALWRAMFSALDAKPAATDKQP